MRLLKEYPDLAGDTFAELSRNSKGKVKDKIDGASADEHADKGMNEDIKEDIDQTESMIKELETHGCRSGKVRCKS